jgi:hypothetical protein
VYVVNKTSDRDFQCNKTHVCILHENNQTQAGAFDNAKKIVSQTDSDREKDYGVIYSVSGPGTATFSHSSEREQFAPLLFC